MFSERLNVELDLPDNRLDSLDRLDLIQKLKRKFVFISLKLFTCTMQEI